MESTQNFEQKLNENLVIKNKESEILIHKNKNTINLIQTFVKQWMMAIFALKSLQQQQTI
jgi:hypothetical protein